MRQTPRSLLNFLNTMLGISSGIVVSELLTASPLECNWIASCNNLEVIGSDWIEAIIQAKLCCPIVDWSAEAELEASAGTLARILAR